MTTNPIDTQLQGETLEQTIERVIQQHHISRTHQPTYCCPEDERVYDRLLARQLVEAITAVRAAVAGPRGDDTLLHEFSSISKEAWLAGKSRYVCGLCNRDYGDLVHALKPLSNWLAAVIFTSLCSYRCLHTKELPDLEDGSALVDVLTPEPNKTVETGTEELERLSEHVWSDVDDAIRSFAANSFPAPAESVKVRSSHFNDAAIDKGFPDHISRDGTAYYRDGTVLKPHAPAESTEVEGEQENKNERN